MKNETLSNGKTRAEMKAIINDYLLNCISCEDHTVKAADAAGNIVEMPVICETPLQKVNFVVATFESTHNYPQNIKRYPNVVDRFADHLQGLPSYFNMAFENYRIIEIAKEWGALPVNATEAQEDKILANWFNYISVKFFQLHKQLNHLNMLLESKARSKK